MSGDSNINDPFIRWQSRSNEQLGFLNNLLIGLSIGLLALEIQLVFNNDFKVGIIEKWFFVSSTILVCTSMLIGCILAWNRLQDFRNTSQIARLKDTVNTTEVNKLQTITKRLGIITWILLRIQIILFALGGLGLIISSCLKLFSN
jgi:hypothetical protein